MINRAELAQLIDDVMSDPLSCARDLARGRTAYWQPYQEVLVISDPEASHGGTALVPTRGTEHWEELE